MSIDIKDLKRMDILKDTFKLAKKVKTIAGFIVVYPLKSNKLDDKSIEYSITKEHYADKMDKVVAAELPSLFKNAKDKTYIAEIYTEEGSGSDWFYLVFKCNNDKDSHFGKIVVVSMENSIDFRIKHVDYVTESLNDLVDGITLYEAMEYIDGYLTDITETTHYDTDRYGHTVKIKGNKNRILNAADKEVYNNAEVAENKLRKNFTDKNSKKAEWQKYLSNKTEDNKYPDDNTYTHYILNNHPDPTIKERVKKQLRLRDASNKLANK